MYVICKMLLKVYFLLHHREKHIIFLLMHLTTKKVSLNNCVMNSIQSIKTYHMYACGVHAINEYIHNVGLRSISDYCENSNFEKK